MVKNLRLLWKKDTARIFLLPPGSPQKKLSEAMSKGSGAYLSLAARFAAKEAFGKALGTGLRGIVLKDIMVKNNHNGQPEILVSGTALLALENSGARKIHVSLTHEKDYAIAMVVLENEL